MGTPFNTLLHEHILVLQKLHPSTACGSVNWCSMWSRYSRYSPVNRLKKVGVQYYGKEEEKGFEVSKKEPLCARTMRTKPKSSILFFACNIEQDCAISGGSFYAHIIVEIV